MLIKFEIKIELPIIWLSSNLERLEQVLEVLDVHGPTGGYNLKLAFSTGYLAGLSAGLEYANADLSH